MNLLHLAGGAPGRTTWVVTKVISGGQTGADRGGLDAAIALNIPHGGYAPQGRRAEDGVIPARYVLEELPTSSYAARTAMNVRTADATLLLVHGKAALARSRGTKLTLDMALRYGRPWWAADPRREEHVARVVTWLKEISAQSTAPVIERFASEDVAREFVLNVAGPRESRAPGIQAQAAAFVAEVLRNLARVG